MRWTSRARTIATELVDQLNKQTHWHTDFRARFSWRMLKEPEDDNLHVVVVPASVARQAEEGARDFTSRNYGIGVIVYKRLQQTSKELDETEVDALVYLAQQIWEFVEPSTCTDDPDPPNPQGQRGYLRMEEAEYVETAHEDESLFDGELIESNIFMHAVTFTFEDVR